MKTLVPSRVCFIFSFSYKWINFPVTTDRSSNVPEMEETCAAHLVRLTIESL